MPVMRTKSAVTRDKKPLDFDEQVDRCLSMVMHYAEVQDIASMVKRVHLQRSQETTQCVQKQ
jgi:hypothetical protein